MTEVSVVGMNSGQTSGIERAIHEVNEYMVES